MFKRNETNEQLIIDELKSKILELESQLNSVANDNGSIIIKQLPNGQIELNGVEIDNDTPVEYYNSSKATFGELTMFRIGKEAKQREMDRLISTHMDEIDRYNAEINNLQNTIAGLQVKSNNNDITIENYKTIERKLQSEVTKLKDQNQADKEMAEIEKQTIIERYDGMINALEEDIKIWKERYLKINNVTLDGTIITKYGEICP